MDHEIIVLEREKKITYILIYEFLDKFSDISNLSYLCILRLETISIVWTLLFLK